jgi:hypothetical protein
MAESNWKRCTDDILKLNNLDPHTIKGALGSAYDLYYEKGTGRVFAFPQGKPGYGPGEDMAVRVTRGI